MSKLGVWQLRRLLVQVCPFGGSSRGVRQWIASSLEAFQRENPQLEVQVVSKPGNHPHLIAEHVEQRLHPDGTRRPWTVCVRNWSPEEVERKAWLLRNSCGGKAKSLKRRQQTKTPSIQGPWNPYLQVQLAPATPTAAASASS